MKKVLSLLAASMLLCSALSMAASAEGPAYEDGAEYIAYANGAPNWTAVYVNDNTDYKAENVAAAQWNADSYTATLPGQENDEGNKYARLYINAGDPNRFATSGATMEQLSLPNENCNASGEMIDGVWYYVYDLDLATDLLHDFIYEENSED